MEVLIHTTKSATSASKQMIKGKSLNFRWMPGCRWWAACPLLLTVNTKEKCNHIPNMVQKYQRSFFHCWQKGLHDTSYGSVVWLWRKWHAADWADVPHRRSVPSKICNAMNLFIHLEKYHPGDEAEISKMNAQPARLTSLSKSCQSCHQRWSYSTRAATTSIVCSMFCIHCAFAS